MDPTSLLHTHRKILLDTLQNRSGQTHPTTTTDPAPPAYTPTPSLPHPFPTSAILAFNNHNNALNGSYTNDDDDNDDDDLPPPPPITIKIDTTTKIVGHGNVLAYSPTETATRVAAMLVAALRQAKVLEGGAMRPVEINVGAGVSVVGCRNVVGATGVRGLGKGPEKEKEGTETCGGGASGRKRGAEEVSGFFRWWIRGMSLLMRWCRSWWRCRRVRR